MPSRKRLNIALIDLNHMTLGLHTNTTPLGIGCIGWYLKKHVSHDFDIRMFKDPHKFLRTLKKWKPDVLGMAQYCWNSNLNLHMARTVKRDNPSCVVVAGGPNLYLSPEEKLTFLKKEDVIDICVSHDGEIPFADILNRVIAGDTAGDIRKSPIAGAYAIDPSNGKLVESKAQPPRLKALNDFDSIYAQGWFDGLLDDGFHPFLQTHRGCPFKCTYCHTAEDYCDRVIFQSADKFAQDMEYLGKRYKGKHDTSLYLANPNFSLFKEDFDIARIIRKAQDRYDWPKNIVVNTGKDPNRLLDLVSILKYKFIPYIAMQTITPHVVKNIRRRNISFTRFVAFQEKVTRTVTKETTSELILSLPGETKETFLNGLMKLLDSGVQKIVIYTLISLRGTLIGSREHAQKYGHVIRHRLIPRSFSDIDSTKVFESEDVVIGTKDMSFEDYMALRGLTLIVTVFANSAEMFPIRKFLLEKGIGVSAWVIGMHNAIKGYPELHSAYQAYLDETKKELFKSREELVKFFSEEKNYELLLGGVLGDNLLRKYKTMFLSRCFEECLNLGLSELKKLTSGFLTETERDSLIESFKAYLRTRDIGHVFKEGCYTGFPKQLVLEYDIPKWLSSEEKAKVLESCKGSYSYSVDVTEYAQNRLKNFKSLKRDPGLSVQILYRDGYTRDFWPAWQREINAKL